MTKYFFIYLLLFLFSCNEKKETSVNSSYESIKETQLEDEVFIPLQDKKKYYQAIKYFYKSEYSKSLKLLDDFISKYKSSIDESSIYSYSYYMVGFIYKQMLATNTNKIDTKVDAELSIDYFKKYIDIDKHKTFWYKANEQIARIYYLMGIDENRTNITNYAYKSIQLKSNNPSVYRLLGNYYFYYSEFEKALKNYEMSKKLDPENFWSYIGIASVNFYLEKYDEALLNYKKALKRNPKSEIAKRNIRNIKKLENKEKQ